MKVINFDSINSTNLYCKENREKLDSFTFITAKTQTAGKGRNDRKWLSNSGENLLFSVLIKDKNLLEKFNILSIGTACIIGEFLEQIGLKNVSVKWPNDIYVNDKKICGILLEGEISKYLVIGIGLNVNQTVFNGDYRTTPTSIRNEINKDIGIEQMSINLFTLIENKLKDFSFNNFVCNYLNSHNYLYNKYVEINNVSGVVTGISNNGYLIIDGKEICSGEITKIH